MKALYVDTIALMSDWPSRHQRDERPIYTEGKRDFSGLLAHTFPLAEYGKAVETFFDNRRTDAIKINLIP